MALVHAVVVQMIALIPHLPVLYVLQLNTSQQCSTAMLARVCVVGEIEILYCRKFIFLKKSWQTT